MNVSLQYFLRSRTYYTNHVSVLLSTFQSLSQATSVLRIKNDLCKIFSKDSETTQKSSMKGSFHTYRPALETRRFVRVVHCTATRKQQTNICCDAYPSHTLHACAAGENPAPRLRARRPQRIQFERRTANGHGMHQGERPRRGRVMSHRPATSTTTSQRCRAIQYKGSEGLEDAFASFTITIAPFVAI